MKKGVMTVGRAVLERAAGSRPSSLRALTAAAFTGGAAATLTYRVLRSEDSRER
jgi:hypothetical protein